MTAYVIHNAVFAATLIYGVVLGSVAYMFNGALVLPILIWILVGLYRYKTPTKMEKIKTIVLFSIIVLMGVFAFLGKNTAVEMIMFLFLVLLVSNCFPADKVFRV